MQNLRDNIKSSPYLWLACLLPALLLMLSMQLHIHVHADHQHDAHAPQHSHQAGLHNTHLGNDHDADHGYKQHHPETDAFAVDITPEGLNKTSTLTLLAYALISTIILLLLPLAHKLSLKSHNGLPPYVRKGLARPPQLRAPPL